ncbi:MAG TPA: hypothetical protein VKM93_13740 [Terriglobia bacterium]|nr:hypothetical protein [Terriglobia bacterium]
MWFGRISEQKARTLAALFSATSLLLAAALVGTCVYAYRLVELYRPTRLAVLPNPPASPLQVHYQLDVPGRGEIFPALAAGSPSDTWPVAILTIVNASDRPLLQTVSAEIFEWSRLSATTVIVGPRETRAVRINPELLPQAYQNNEIRRATLEVSASSPADPSEYTQTCSVYLHSVSDLYWGQKFANAQFIARWVTPHDPAVAQLVASARKYVARGRLAGYDLPGEGSKSRVAIQVRTEARAVFEAMRHLRISYVDSMYTFGSFTTEAERVRLPRETLLLSSANCIDVSVAFASAMENLGIDPVIVIVPGHAFMGVRLAPDSRQFLYLDLTVLPDGSFDQAISRANHWLKRRLRIACWRSTLRPLVPWGSTQSQSRSHNIPDPQ